MISKNMLRKDNPVQTEMDDGRANSVLALWKDDIWCESNTYLSQWIVTNTAYYNANADEFEGWYPLEDMMLPDRLRASLNQEGQ